MGGGVARGGAFRREGCNDKPKDEFGRGLRQRWKWEREIKKTTKEQKGTQRKTCLETQHPLALQFSSCDSLGVCNTLFAF